MRTAALVVISIASLCYAHADHGTAGSSDDDVNAWQRKYGGSPELTFSGITTFAHLPHWKCLDESDKAFDIAVLGAPFDTSVSFRPGARFGPYAIRSGSRRHHPSRSYSIPWGFNPYTEGAAVIDCGDIPVSPYDNALAMDQIETAYTSLLARPVATEWTEQNGGMKSLALDGKEHPRIISLGGDHTIVLPVLRSLKKVYGEIAVIHFDAHLDTWNGNEYIGAWSEQSKLTHGSFFWKASLEGLISNTSSIHAGIRTRLSSIGDLTHDEVVGFKMLTTDDIDDMGADGIVAAIRQRVGKMPTYLSFDIDTVDPSQAPGTGTPETGGWSMREVKRVLRGLSGLNIVGLDLVEVSPAYDTNADLTGLAAADIVQEFIAILLKKGERVPAVQGMKFNFESSKTTHHDEL